MKRNPLIYSLTRRVAQLVFTIFYQIRVSKRLGPPEQGPLVILPKHQYWTDIPIVSLAFKSLLYFVAKRELFEYPLIRDYLFLLGGIPVDRKQTLRTLDSFKYLLKLLE
ncbi:MAG: lysophospholipid acyltransferase family protein, partial [Thermodesulfobacteriota bacterium]